MSFLQNFKLSDLTFVAGVFFALFILSACAGSVAKSNDSACAPQEDLVADGTCLPYLTEAECVAVGFAGVDEEGNCIPVAPADCIKEGLNVSANGICIASTYAQCSGQDLKGVGADGRCLKYTDDECDNLRYNGVNTSDTVDNGKCVEYTAKSECTDERYKDLSSDGTCIGFSQNDCVSNKYNGVGTDGKCVKYTQSECTDLGYKDWDATAGNCLAYTKVQCLALTNKHYFPSNMRCVTDNYTPKTLADFQTAEYNQSDFLDVVKAAEAYANIELLIDADNNSGAITQAGEGQIVSIVSKESYPTDIPEFNRINSDGTVTQGAVFDSIYNAWEDKLYTSNADILDRDKGNCLSGCNDTYKSTVLLVRNKDGQAITGAHGIAYNAKLKGIGTYGDYQAQLPKIIAQGAGSDIIAMTNTLWSNDEIYSCYDDGSNISQYPRPKGVNVPVNRAIDTDGDGIDDACDTTTTDYTLATAELTAWKAAVDPAGSNNTIMVFPTGYIDGYNSEYGYYTDIIGDVRGTNIPDLHAAYPALYDESAGKDQIKGNADDAMGLDGIAGNDDDDDADFTSDRWLAVVRVWVDTTSSSAIYSDYNGCGVAMNFCLAVPDGYHTIAMVSGGLAVLKGAFPNATPEQLTKLVLETATYLPLDNQAWDTATASHIPYVQGTHGTAATEDEEYRTEVTKADGTKRYINMVYGYGLLNLEAATTPSLTASYVTASNNTSIGALWKDSSLKLSSHFGGGLDDVKLGIGDPYGRHFTVKANKTNITPIALTIDDYMVNWQLLGDNVQSHRLGTQARANYSNSSQSWMDFEYKAGKATTKIAFQENYKSNPLTDMGATSILRANNIRPASNNIGMMDVDYQLGKNLSLSSYAARGEYDTGYHFDELGTDIDVNYKKSSLNIGLGNVREHEQFLGTNTTGAYALRTPSVSQFTDVTYGHDIGKKFNIYANYINYKTDVNMGYSQFATIDNLQADQYQIGFKGKNLISDDDNLNVALITKLGVTDGTLNQNTVRGYNADGSFRNVSQSYDLAVSERHQQLEITYQGRLYQNTDKVSALKHNRFFTTLRVDQNLNHVQGAGQTEIVSGINARF